MEDGTRRCRGRASARGQARDGPGTGSRVAAADAKSEPRPVPTPRGTPVERPRAGDRVAFERLLERWLEPSLRTACAIIGDKADARDATQKVKTAEATSSAQATGPRPCAGRSASPGLAAR